MRLATKIQDKLDDIYYDNMLEDGIISKAKCIGSAILSGVIDGTIIAFPILMIGCIAKFKKWFYNQIKGLNRFRLLFLIRIFYMPYNRKEELYYEL